MNVFKYLYILSGTISLAIGLIGIFVPGLPTTPFLLITAALYVKSSDRLYKKLISTPLIGEYILEFKSNKGMTLKTKLFAIGSMWGMIIISCLFFIKSIVVIISILPIGILGTIVMGFVVKTVNRKFPENKENL